MPPWDVSRRFLLFPVCPWGDGGAGGLYVPCLCGLTVCATLEQRQA